MVKRMDVIGVTGIPIRVVFVPAGEQAPNHSTNPEQKDLIEFYDLRYPHTPEDGQFISRYFAETLLDSYGNYAGLDLHGGEADWKIDVLTKRMVMDWYRYQERNETRTTTQEPKESLRAVVIQQGGSSSEFYAAGYNGMKDAQKAVKNHEEDSYSAAALEVPEPLRKRLLGDDQAEIALLELVEKAARVGSDL